MKKEVTYTLLEYGFPTLLTVNYNVVILNLFRFKFVRCWEIHRKPYTQSDIDNLIEELVFNNNKNLKYVSKTIN